MSILLVIVTALTAVLYLPAWLAAVSGARADGLRETGERYPPGALSGSLQNRVARGIDTVSLLLAGGSVCHAYALYLAVVPGEGFRYGFAQALSATFWVGSLLLWLEGLSVRVQALRILILPAAALAAALPLVFPGSDLALERSRPLFLPHLVTGTLAYGVLTLAALHAVLMTAVERELHAGRRRSLFGRWVEELPPLLSLERMLFRLILVGFMLLSLTVFSGVLFSEATFGRPLRLDHKTVFAILSWVLFGILLAGRWLRGWRGRTALRLTMWGFWVLVLAYVGSRFVLEVVLQRA